MSSQTSSSATAVDAAGADAVPTPSAFVLDFTLDVHPGRLGVDSVRVPVVGGEAVLRLRPSVALRDALLLYGLRVRLLSAGAFTRVHTMRIVSPLPDHHHLSQPPPWLSLSRAASNLSSIPLIPLHYSSLAQSPLLSPLLQKRTPPPQKQKQKQKQTQMQKERRATRSRRR
jgi:hypothetical protein